jgi:hypothetical protein
VQRLQLTLLLAWFLAVNMDAIKYAENINKALGRFYIRTTALNLNDLTGLNNGVEDWISSAGLRRILPKGAQETIIASTQQRYLCCYYKR